MSEEIIEFSATLGDPFLVNDLILCVNFHQLKEL